MIYLKRKILQIQGLWGLDKVPTLHEISKPMQTIGRHDKNGRLIYVGDIVKVNPDLYKPNVLEVKFDADLSRYVLCNADGDLVFNMIKDCSVISNIYEKGETK